MTVQRLSEKFCETIEVAIKANAAGDEIGWEAGLAGTPEGLVFAVMIQLPSPIVGESLVANVFFGKGSATTDDEVTDQITRSIESLRQARSEMLAATPG